MDPIKKHKAKKKFEEDAQNMQQPGVIDLDAVFLKSNVNEGMLAGMVSERSKIIDRQVKQLKEKDNRIKTLQDELTKLKTQHEELKEEHLRFKKGHGKRIAELEDALIKQGINPKDVKGKPGNKEESSGPISGYKPETIEETTEEGPGEQEEIQDTKPIDAPEEPGEDEIEEVKDNE